MKDASISFLLEIKIQIVYIRRKKQTKSSYVPAATVCAVPMRSLLMCTGKYTAV